MKHRIRFVPRKKLFVVRTAQPKRKARTLAAFGLGPWIQVQTKVGRIQARDLRSVRKGKKELVRINAERVHKGLQPQVIRDLTPAAKLGIVRVSHAGKKLIVEIEPRNFPDIAAGITDLQTHSIPATESTA